MVIANLISSLIGFFLASLAFSTIYKNTHTDNWAGIILLLTLGSFIIFTSTGVYAYWVRLISEYSWAIYFNGNYSNSISVNSVLAVRTFIINCVIIGLSYHLYKMVSR